MSRTFWNNVTVVGCGLIGASFALALRRAGGELAATRSLFARARPLVNPNQGKF